jgi:hypothetical protein
MICCHCKSEDFCKANCNICKHHHCKECEEIWEVQYHLQIPDMKEIKEFHETIVYLKNKKIHQFEIESNISQKKNVFCFIL